MPDQVTFEASILAQLELSGLQVTESVLGSAHIFPFEGTTITIRLPSADQEARDFDDGPLRKCEWRSGDKDPETTWYSIECVVAEADTGRRLTTDAEVMRRPIKAFDLMDSAEQGRADAFLKDYGARLLAGFAHWQEVIRWVTRSTRLGSGSSVRVDDVANARIVRKSDKKAYWAHAQIAVAMGGTRLDRATFTLVQDALDSGMPPPLWFRYLTEFSHRSAAGDTIGALLSLAIACETVMRSLLWAVAGNPANPLVATLLDRANAQTILGKWAGFLGLSKAEAKEWPLSKIHELFDLRNSLIHEGATGKLSPRLLQEFGRAARDFIERADLIHCRLTGRREYRIAAPR